MVNHALKGVLGAFISGSLMFSSTIASASAPPAAPQVSPWAVLSALSDGAPAATMCGSTVAAQTTTGCVLPTVQMAQADQQPQQQQQQPPPPPPIPPISAPSGVGLGIDPLILGLLAIAAGVGIYLAVHHHGNSNSPA